MTRKDNNSVLQATFQLKLTLQNTENTEKCTNCKGRKEKTNAESILSYSRF
jgi:hypothetical protein